MINDPFDPELDLSPPEERYRSNAAENAVGPAPARRPAVRNLLSVAVCCTTFGVTYLLVSHATDRPAAPQAEPVQISTESAASAVEHAAAPFPEASAGPTEERTLANASRGLEDKVWPLPIAVRPAFSPSFGAQGRRVVFHTDRGSQSIVMTAALREDGTVEDVATLVEGNGRNFHGRLSPDGQFLAFDSDRDGVRGVYLAAADGSDARRVTGAGYAAVPTWSPDGRKLAFVVGDARKPKVWNLAVLDIATGAVTRVSRHRAGQVWAGSWFPDGRLICYSHEDQLIIVNLESGETRRFRSPVPRRMVRTPAVSPDGRQIAFQVYRDGLWLLDVGTGSVTRVLKDPTAEEFDWTPDARRLAFHSRRDGSWRIWMIAFDRA